MDGTYKANSKIKPQSRIVLVAVERKGVVSFSKLTYCLQKSLRSFKAQKNRKILSKVLTAISCPLKAPDRFT